MTVGPFTVPAGTYQPLAYPSISWDGPRLWPPGRLADHPALWLCPSTNQNGLPLPSTVTVHEVRF